LPDKQGYDVPVPGDWITVAVIAERGPIKFTRAPVTIEAEDGDSKKKGKAGVSEPEKYFGKKYVNLKLIDFGARSSSTTTSVIRGDAFLTLLLFESDGFDLIPREDGMKPEKLYKGGSRGAFENLTNVKEGDVIALLNPKILKPYQVSSTDIFPFSRSSTVLTIF
jgi:minichromosome maintenance protein 10